MSDPMNKIINGVLPAPEDVWYELEPDWPDDHVDERLAVYSGERQKFVRIDPDYELNRNYPYEVDPNLAADFYIWMSAGPHQEATYHIDDTYAGFETDLLSDYFPSVATSLAKFYSSYVDGLIDSEARKDIEVTQYYRINDNGQVEASRKIEYMNGEAIHQMDLWRDWDYCNNTSSVGRDSFSELGCKISNMYLIPEPARLDNIIRDFRIEDRNNDGRVDFVDTEWLNSHGWFTVSRTDDSSYVAGILKYFDPLLEKAGYDYSSYHMPNSLEDIFVGKGDEVDEGDPLFSYKTDDGIKTFRALEDGTITGVITDITGYYIDLKKKESLFSRIAEAF